MVACKRKSALPGLRDSGCTEMRRRSRAAFAVLPDGYAELLGLVGEVR
jgi:hypothetical protein